MFQYSENYKQIKQNESPNRLINPPPEKLGKARNIILLHYVNNYALYRVHTLFQKQISRTFPGLIDFSRALKVTLTPTLPRS